jgi:hypothetical protein
VALFGSDIEVLIARGRYAKAAKRLMEELESGSRDPRTRLRLADVLVMENRAIEALPLLLDLADDYAAEQQVAKAIALLKKVQRLSPGHRDAEERLAALIRTGKRDRAVPAPPDRTAGTAEPSERASAYSPAPIPDDYIERVRTSTWTPSTHQEPEAGTVEDSSAIEVIPEPDAPLPDSPLFTGFSQEELLAVIRGFRLRTFEPGDVIILEGETGDFLFIVTTGTVKAFVRNPAGGEPVLVRRMREGDFFGEIAILSGKARTATVTAATAVELLEMDHATLDRITDAHPRVRQVLEEFYVSRASTQEEAMRRNLEAKGTPRRFPG